jgi:chorismate mutase
LEARFLRLARGSLEELVDDMTVCEDERYVPPASLKVLREQAMRVEKILNGCIRYLLNENNKAEARERNGEYTASAPAFAESWTPDRESPQ